MKGTGVTLQTRTTSRNEGENAVLKGAKSTRIISTSTPMDFLAQEDFRIQKTRAVNQHREHQRNLLTVSKEDVPSQISHLQRRISKIAFQTIWCEYKEYKNYVAYKVSNEDLFVVKRKGNEEARRWWPAGCKEKKIDAAAHKKDMQTYCAQVKKLLEPFSTIRLCTKSLCLSVESLFSGVTL